MTTEIHQSALYSKYIKDLGWSVEKLDGNAVFFRRFPFLGTLAKLQRFERLPDRRKTIAFLRTHRVRVFAPEPASGVSQSAFSSWVKALLPYTRLNASPFLPTKTILIDLTPSQDEIFKKFSEAKRRAVRRAQKRGVTVGESENLDAMLDVKKRASGLFGFIVVSNIPQLWKTFAPASAAILLAHHPSSSKPVGGILLLFWKKRAYYWLVGATKQGKKLSAPTLLVWEALLLSKKHGCTEFDFLGVNDERLPRDNPSWRGFTKFKEGFGGEAFYYPHA